MAEPWTTRTTLQIVRLGDAQQSMGLGDMP